MICFFGILIFALLYSIISYNTIRHYNLKVDEALANIDVSLAKRYHVLSQSYEVTKGYAKHEKEVLLDISKLRTNKDVSLRDEMMEKMESSYREIFILKEAYPELKANTVFKSLQDSIIESEETLMASRRIYNSNVSIFNRKIEMFPSNLIAQRMNVSKRDFLEFTLEETSVPVLK